MCKIILIFTLLILTQLSVDATTSISGYENSLLSLNCDEGYGIEIEVASWISYGKLNGRNKRDSCIYGMKYYFENICNGLQNCEIRAENPPENGCTGKIKLEIDYNCLPCSDGRRKRSGKFFRCDLTSRIPQSSNNFLCPNPRFIAKHVTSHNPDDTDGASMHAIQANFARVHSPVARTNLNSVFVTTPNQMTYHLDNGYCKFDYPVSKYNCNPSGNWGWSCTYMGRYFALHDPLTGHYHPELDVHEHDENF